MAALRKAQKEMFDHSEAKVLFLKKYLERYLNVLINSQFVGTINLFDLFCGEGVYPNGGKGSPIILAELIKDLFYQYKAQGKDVGFFKCHFNDLDNSKVNNVKTIIEERKLLPPQYAECSYTSTDYQTHKEEVIDKVSRLPKNEKAFVFIDPYQYGEIRISDIRRLLSNGQTEVLLWLPTQQMFRFEKNGTPNALMEFISELVPIKDWPKNRTGLEFIDTLVEHMRKLLSGIAYVDSFVLERDKNQYYCLFFFTPHIYGFDRMLDVKWSIDEEDGRGWRNPKPDLFTAQEKIPKTEKLRSILAEFLENERTNGELYETTITSGFLPKHTNSILEQFQNQGALTVNALGKTRKGAFYNSYPNYRDTPNRITFKLN